MRRVVLAFFAAALYFPAGAGAQPLPERDVPPALRPWVAWIRDEVPDRACPVVQGTALCLWPGRLDLVLGAPGGTFKLEAYADRALDLRLPGDAQRWPQDVRLDGRPAVVAVSEGGPAVRLTAGAHRLEGRFAWSHLPDSLPVPPRLALVDLSVDGRSVALPRRDEAGLVWLRAGGESAGKAESLRVQAFRRIVDGIPLWAETRLQLEVSGKAREVELRGALLPGSVPVAVSGDLPARLDASGRLHVQLRAGTFAVAVLARLENRPQTLTPPPVFEPWPAREVWVFAADERLRQVELSGLAPVDSSRTDLPAEWRKLPAFAVEAGARLTLKEVRRGEPVPPPDRIRLHRELWLDLAGGAFTVRDNFSGALSRTWRLDLQRPGELGRAALDRTDQLITSNPTTQAPGLELRRGALNLEADSRVPRSGRLLAVGWSADVERLEGTLHLPPGWWLLAATGVDEAPGAWAARWTLLGFFFVLIVALATGRIFGRGWGVVALLAMTLTYAEPEAPFLVWLSLLGATALSAVAPAGRLAGVSRLWRAVSVLALLLCLIPFLRDQVREALYPQVGRGEGIPDFFVAGSHAARAPAAPPPANQAPMTPEAADKLKALGYVTEEGIEGGVAGGVVGGKLGGLARTRKSADEKTIAKDEAEPRAKAGRQYASSLNVALEQDPRAVLQTGPGVPSWSWRSYPLAWSGPVKGDQTVRLFLISSGLNRLITFLRLLLVLLLAGRLLVGGGLRLSAGAPAALMLALLALTPTPAGAQEGGAFPDRALLEELKRRLTRPEPCQPNCISTSSLRLRLAEGGLSFEAEVHAADAGAWAIPGPPTSWAPSRVRVDNQPTSALARLDDGFLYVRVSPGVHRLEVAGPAPPADTLTLQLRDRPQQASADAPGWEIAGLRRDGPPDISIQLSRRLRAGEHAREEAGQYAPWLEIKRTLSLGLTWRVRTEVHRVSQTGSPVSLSIPLLRGEAPLEADLETKDGVARVALGRDQAEAGWSSTLPLSDALSLKAPEGQPWSEVWQLECGVIWQCEADGLPPVSRESQGVLAPEFRPWPGESLTLRFRRPQAVAGPTVTVDSLRIDTTPGGRLSTTVLTLAVRASREESFVLTIPPDAEVQEVTVGGTARPGKPDQAGLRLTVPAGTQAVIVKWREPRGMSLYHRVPAVGLPLPAVNVETTLHLPDNRWLLYARGPAWGPAVLFWSYLGFALLVAFCLGLFAESPLGVGQWLLLALGLTQTSALGGVLVAGLFVALSWRARQPRSSALAHDALQVLLAVWVAAALVLLYDVVQTGLLLRPDMQVAGAGSTNTVLRWYTDRIDHTSPSAGVLSLPLWTYRGLMLAWALWLAKSLLRWGAWAWRALAAGGWWRPLSRPRRKAAAAPDAAPASPPSGPPASGGPVESGAKGL
ncbi:MAG TPA: hypothetical protein VN461_20360 [Vicinamibacteria bacterium]|nr:hypothetical protein [Vicinamibacteria bacterium]